MFQLDILWIVVGGESALEYMASRPDAVHGLPRQGPRLGHARNADGTIGKPVEDAGPGMLDFPDVFRAGDRGDKHFFIEHDEPQLATPAPRTPSSRPRRRGSSIWQRAVVAAHGYATGGGVPSALASSPGSQSHTSTRG